MRRIFVLLIVLITVCSLNGEVLDAIIAKVGRDIILQSDLDRRMQQLSAAGVLTEDITMFDVLNDMIESMIIIQQAKHEEYEVNDKQMKSMGEEQIGSISSQFSSEYEFKKELAKANLTVIELKEYYIQMFTEQSLKNQIIDSKIKNKIHLTEVEVEDYYEEHKSEIPSRPEMDQIGMIVRNIKAGKETINIALVKINKIRDLILEGDDFEEMAKEYSECPSSASGGNLGYFEKGTMVKPFEDTAFSLIPGDISEVVKTDFGYHIIRVEEKKDDKIKASHILIKVEPTEEDIKATVLLMETVLEKLRAGEDFSELAKTYSEDDSTAVKGGIIGEYPKDDYPDFCKESLESIGYKEYTDVIRKENKVYIFTKIKNIPERTYNYVEIYDKLRELVKTQKEMELYENWIKELIRETYVEILIEG